MLCVGRSVLLKRHHGSTEKNCLSSIRMKFQDSQIARNSFHGETIASMSHGRTCAGVIEFYALSVACIKQVSWAPVHVEVCTLNRCFWHQFTYLAIRRAFTCARVYAVVQSTHARLYKAHMCTYILGGGMRLRSWINCFFSVFTSESEKQKMWT